MEKAYDHTKYESKIYQLWELSNAFSPIVPKSKNERLLAKPFCIIMPPPNANDPLHIGHARFVAIEDILIRYHRMKGEVTLWLPGSDHAGIETQFVFEKRLKEQGKSRFDFDRNTLYKMIMEYVQTNTKTMHNQLRQLGASCDWSRHKFTLDPDIVQVVLNTFKKLYDEGYIYRGKRIVNYCPYCGTNFSELEVDYKETEDEIYHLNYGVINIATTRPETIFADVAVAVNPNDKKHTSLIGKTAVIPIIKREVPIIADVLVDPNFGTGALKITPAHSATDFDIGIKHKLPIISVLDDQGKMTNCPVEYLGLKANQARKKVVEDLETQGYLIKKELITHTVGHCYRCKGTIEPKVSEQWFVKMKELSRKAIKLIKDKEIVFPSRKYEKFAKNWLKSLRDWNISRQIVWGIQIPAFRCQKCLEWTITNGGAPQNCHFCKHDKLIQDQDTFDTWFSSGQWPYATLKTTNPNDFEFFYPTTIMNTSYDIIPFWIIRMIMLGFYETQKPPFKVVLVHGLVRDKHGIKISKSKGNVIDPIEMVEKYGSDALRMGLIWGANLDNDISLSEENIKGQRNFCNKLWNISRFVLANIPNKSNYKFQILKPKTKNSDDKEILQKLTNTVKKVTKLLDKYRLNEAAERIYSFIWKDFANDYLEKSKLRKVEAQPVLEYVLSISLKLAHPFMPFVTETIWQEINKNSSGKNNLLINSSWPKN
ncbi:MAG: valine--tRNA ligase [Patescibacteria group bacterium]|nr:valine--tRNA ligase [Patescibacteria group bacterium]